MPKMHVEKSIQIDASPEKVFAKINDFHHWPAWSPWLIAEPEAKVTVAADGKSYSWEGQRVGSGEMAILSETPNQSLSCDLTFLKPWKSTAKTNFNLKPVGSGTEVSWSMDSSLPFFMFFMKKSMIAYIGSDYDRGLSMLKDLVEKNNVPSKLDFKGEEAYPGCKYVGIRTVTTADKIGPQMESDFGKLRDFISEHKLESSHRLFSIYHKWDMVSGTVAYTVGVPLAEVPKELPAGFIEAQIPSVPVYTLRHTGSYRHLGNAWSTMYMMQRNKEIKLIKKVHPFETYVNNPAEVAEEDLITEIHFAVR